MIRLLTLVSLLLWMPAALGDTPWYRQWDSSHAETQVSLAQFSEDMDFLTDVYRTQFYRVFDGNDFGEDVISNPVGFDAAIVATVLRRVREFVEQGILSEPHRQSIAQWMRFQELQDKNIRRMELNWGDPDHYGSLPARIAREGDDAELSKLALAAIIERDFFVLPLGSDLEYEARYRALLKTMKAHYQKWVGGKGGTL